MADTPMGAAIPPKLDLKRGLAAKPVASAEPSATVSVSKPDPAPIAPVVEPVPAPAPVEVKIMPVPVALEAVAEAVPVPEEPAVVSVPQKPATARLTVALSQPVASVAEASAPAKPLAGPVTKAAFPRPAGMPGPGIRPGGAIGVGQVGGKTVRLKTGQPMPVGPLAGPKPATIIAGGVKPVAVAGAPATIAKKETSRIPLEMAQPASAKLPSPVLKVVSGPAAAGAPTVIKAPAFLDGSSPEVIASKRKTSRISLDSVLTSSGAAEGRSQAPKTIKLKRPSEAVTVKAVKAGLSEAPSKTSRLDEVAAPEAESEEGGKKTIKVHRHGGAPHAMHVGGAAVAPMAVGQTGPAVIVDKCNPFFPIWTMISLILALVIIWMFCAQTYGRDYCLTRFSYSTDAPDLPWPGKLQKGMQ